MSKNYLKSGDERGNRAPEDWAKKIEKFRDPVTGKVLPQNPQGDAYPAGQGKIVSND